MTICRCCRLSWIDLSILMSWIGLSRWGSSKLQCLIFFFFGDFPHLLLLGFDKQRLRWCWLQCTGSSPACRSSSKPRQTWAKLMFSVWHFWTAMPKLMRCSFYLLDLNVWFVKSKDLLASCCLLWSLRLSPSDSLSGPNRTYFWFMVNACKNSSFCRLNWIELSINRILVEVNWFLIFSLNFLWVKGDLLGL